ncbi:hypothetical protein TAMA11512_03400 [Selenomonas sp. TAMA-11512]|nr:hypothetical protein TAMA11512_03400 [Selenomonas sp. TAMA-11512]
MRALRLLLEARTLLSGRFYDAVLDIQDLFLTGLLSRFAETERRIGIVDRHEGSWLFIPERIPSSSTQKLHHYLDVLTAIDIEDARRARPRLHLPASPREMARSLLKSRGILPGCPYLAVSVQSSWTTKEWPAAYFGEALSALPAALPIVFIGSLQDEVKISSICEHIRKEAVSPPPLTSLAGCTTLLELAAVLQSAVLYFGPDTGPLHIASAVGTPTLSLWGATRPDVHAPLGARDHALVSPHSCKGCGKTRCRVCQSTNPPPCMTAITPDTVKKTLMDLLSV